MILKVNKVTDNPDGSADVECEYDTEFLALAKAWNNKEKVTEKSDDQMVNDYVIHILKEHVDGGKIYDKQ